MKPTFKPPVKINSPEEIQMVHEFLDDLTPGELRRYVALFDELMRPRQTHEVKPIKRRRYGGLPPDESKIKTVAIARGVIYGL